MVKWRCYKKNLHFNAKYVKIYLTPISMLRGTSGNQHAPIV